MRSLPAVSTPAALAAIVLMPVLGCAGIQRNPAAVELYQGTYTFTGQVSQQMIDGYIAFSEGTFLMSSEAGACSGHLSAILERPPRERTRFNCGTLSVQFQVDGGELGSHARASLRVPEGTQSRTVCEAWTRDPTTQQRVCSLPITQVNTRYVTRHGVLTVAKVEADGN